MQNEINKSYFRKISNVESSLCPAGFSGFLSLAIHTVSLGPHKVLIELEDANHHNLDKGTVTFVVPDKTAAEN